MRLHELVGIDAQARIETPEGMDGNPEVAGIASDSRKVQPGYLFAALAGSKADGATYVADALARGAVAVVAADDAALTVKAPTIRVKEPRAFLARTAARIAGAQPKTMVAVTGTAGKTSVASFTRQIWASVGLPAAMIGTTGVVSPSRNDYGSLTTPDPVELHRLLAELAAEGVTHASMEASSHGLDQHRLDGVTLQAGGFTNLGRDHLDYHADITDYLNAKLRLFTALLPKGAPAIIFSDDAYSDPVISAARDAGLDVRTVGRGGNFLTLKRVEHQRQRQLAEVHHAGKIYEIDLPLAGDFQLSNALVAAGLAISTGVAPDQAMAALERLEGASGRLELVGTTQEGAPAYVDYAHKPKALENVLKAVRPFTTGRIVVVFGCGGDRDRGKRPIMGEIATRLADVVIVTDDNPRSEVPAEIRAEILAAAPGAAEIGDRAEAIRAAVGFLRKGDTLIVAGKGHENGQTIGDKTLPFSDHEQVRAALAAHAQ
jgi:UDP-N-acetylmuramoyl-L-alanyl-D-glutamate--2,6-diaminopimelate ligase